MNFRLLRKSIDQTIDCSREVTQSRRSAQAVTKLEAVDATVLESRRLLLSVVSHRHSHDTVMASTTY